MVCVVQYLEIFYVKVYVCMYVCMYVSMQANSVSAAFHFFVSLVGSGVLKVALKDQYRCVCMYV